MWKRFRTVLLPALLLIGVMLLLGLLAPAWGATEEEPKPVPEQPVPEKPFPEKFFPEIPGPEKPAISFAGDMEQRMREEAARVGGELQKHARSMFQRTPLGFDLGTLDRLQQWALSLPLQLPSLVGHLREQSRLLGFVGSLIMLAFLGAVIYSLMGQQRVLRRLEETVEPLRKQLPEALYPYILSVLRVVVASLIPLLLFGGYLLVHAATTYQAPWFLFTGNLLKLWMVGALLLNLMRESLTRNILPIPARAGTSIFRVARVVVLYILFSLAVLWGAEAFEVPEDFQALLKFLISLSIVVALLFVLLKKNSIVEILPDLPYRSYQVFVRGLDRFYFLAIFLTFITGVLWSLGFKTLCVALWTKTWAVAGAFLGIVLAYHVLQGWLQKWVEKREPSDPMARPLYQAVRSLLLYATVICALAVTLELLGLLGHIRAFLSFPVLHVAQTPLSLWTFIKAALIILGFVFLSRLLRTYLDYKVYPSLGVEEGLAYAINMFLNYLLLAVAFLFAMRAVGLDLRFLMIFAGALGIGIGLGLQNTAANLISGFSLVFGRRIRKGDWVQVDNTVAQVEEVGLRVTKVRNRDNIEYLIPNSDITSKTIVNYSLSEPLIRLHVPAGVSYQADPKEVEKILLRVAGESELVSKAKPPKVRFIGYGDSSLDFDLLVWMDIRKYGRDLVRSEIYFALFTALAEAGIEIPYPQRDLHIRSGLHRPGQAGTGGPETGPGPTVIDGVERAPG